VCQEECHTVACQWDSYDCDCSPGCTGSLLGNSECDPLCNTGLCGFDNGLCVSAIQGKCASGCFDRMLGDGQCDPACYSAACMWDGLDCGCAADCEASEYGTCKPTCLVPDCNYDQVAGRPQCSNEGLRTAALFFHLSIANFTVPFSHSTVCLPKASKCTSAVFASISCVPECNVLVCSFSSGRCPLSSCASKPRHCADCGLQDGSGCLNCEAGSYHLYRSCVSACPIHFHIHPLVPDLCYPDADNTNRSSPGVFVVSPTANPEGSGSLTNPFDSLSAALLCRVFNQTAIELLPGVHWLSLGTASGTLQTWDQSADLQAYLPGTSLTIAASEGAAVVLMYDNLNPLQFTISGRVTIANVTFLGNSTLVPGCSAPLCLYCATLTINVTTNQALDDQGNEHDEGMYAASTLCQRFRFYSVFMLAANATFRLSNVTIAGFRQGLGSIISLRAAQVRLADVIFANISTKAEPPAKPSSGTTSQAVTNAVIQQNSTSTYEAGSLLLQRVHVTLLNNGFELNALQQYGFLVVGGLRNVTVQDCYFTDSVVQTGSLLSVGTVLVFTLQRCHFAYVYVENSLIRLIPTGVLSFSPADSDGRPSDFYQNHLSITSSSFEHVVVMVNSNMRDEPYTGNLLYVAITGQQGMNVLIDSLTFEFCLASYFVVVTRTLPTSVPSSELYGNTTRYTSGLTRVTLTIPFNWVRVNSVSFQSAYAGKNLIFFSKMGNVEMTQVSFLDSGDGFSSVSPNTMAVNDLVTRPGVYLTQANKATAMMSCSAPVSYQQVTNATLSHCTFRNSTCISLPIISTRSSTPAGVGGIRVTAHFGPFNLTNVSMSDFSAPTQTGGTCLTLASSGPVGLVELRITRVTNPSTTGGILTLASTAGIELVRCRVESVSSQGPIVQVSGGYFLSLALSTFKTCVVSTVLYFMPMANTTWTGVAVSGSVFTYNTGGDGVIMYLTNIALTPVPLTLTVRDCEFGSNTSTGLAAVVYLDSKSLLTPNSSMSHCTFTGNYAKEALIALYFLSGTLSVSRCGFSDNSAKVTGLVLVSPLPQSTPALILSNCLITRNSGSSLLKVSNPNGVVAVITDNNTYQENLASVFHIDRSNVTDTGSVYQNNQGSALRCSTFSQLNFTGTVFRQGNSTLGGAVYLGGNSNFSCTNCAFTDNAASLHGGAVYIEQESMANVRNCTFIRNKSGLRGAAIYLFGSSVNSTARSCTFRENDSGDSGVLVVISGSLRVTRCDFQANTGRRTVGLSAYFASVTLTSSTFSNHTGLTSPFIYSALESVLTVRNSSVKGLATSSNGGFLYALSSAFVLLGCSFVDIEALTGAVALTNADSTFSIEDTHMSEIKNRDQFGGVLALAGGAGNITNSVLDHFTGGGIVATELSSLHLTSVSISNNPALSTLSTYGGLYCSGCGSLVLTACTFASLSADKGAALYLSGNAFRAGEKSLVVEDTTFTHLKTHEGGVFIRDMNARFQRSHFTSCYAVVPIGDGGALSLHCGLASGCSFLFHSCLFTNNSADDEGGSIHWKDTMPVVEDSVFQGGRAYYGPDFASFPVNVQLTAVQGNGTVGNGTEDYEGSLLGVASGQVATQTLVVSVVDQYNQVVATLNDATAMLVAEEGSSLFGSTSVSSVNGSFTFSGFGLTATPETIAHFKVVTSAVDSARKVTARDNSTYSNSLTVRAVMRPCQMGESFFQNQCAVCPPGKYSLAPQSSCKDCSAKAICYGNFTMVPRAGYWRSSATSDTFLDCPFKASCSGSPEPPAQLEFTGKCAEGYFGNLCNGCLPGFSRLNKAECGRCPSFIVNLVRTSGIGLAFLIALVLIVATAIRSAYQSSSYFSIYIKILLNYLQLVMLTSSFNLNWPTYMLHLVEAQQTVGNVSDQVFSIDCFFENNSPEDQATAVRSKIVILSFLPMLMCLFGALFWLPYALITRRWSKLSNELVTTSVVFFFLIHPSLVKFMFAFLDCRELNVGEYWINAYLNIRCWDPVHMRYALAVAIPSICLWGVGLPTLCLVYLIKQRHKLDLTNNRLRLGFIYNGYDKRKYYWELVILYRKMMIISIAVFLGNVSIYVQALSAMMVILIALALQSKHNPYIVPAMNELELRGILVGGVTVYGGMYSLSGSLDSTSLIVIFVIIVCLNVYFLGFWLIRVGVASWKILIRHFAFLSRLFSPTGYRIQPRVIRTTALSGVLSDPNAKSSQDLSVDLSGALEDELQRSALPVPDNSVMACEASSHRYSPE